MSHPVELHFLSLLTNAAARTGSDLKSALAALDIVIHTGEGQPPPMPLNIIISLLEHLEATSRQGRMVFALAELFNFDNQPAVAAFLASANSLRQLHRLLEWIPALLHPALHFGIEERAGDALLLPAVHADDARLRDHPLLIELMVAVVTRLSRLVAPDMPIVGSVHFRHRPRGPEADYQAFFCRPVYFEAEENRLAGPADMLDGALPGSLPQAHALAEETIRRRILGDGLAPPLPLQIEQRLRAKLSLFSSGLGGMAQALQLHPRTLQRRLQQAGLSYAELLTSVRHSLAKEMLRDAQMDIDSIALKLGYGDRRSFSYAFRQWQGLSPTAYRRSLRKASA